jgi:trigger factor
MEKITVEVPDSINRKITIFVPAEDLKASFDKFYEGLNDKVVLKGFRRGLIPRSVMESQFGTHAKSAISQELFSTFYQKAITDHAINPVANPTVLEYDKDHKIVGKFAADGFTANVLVEVLPKVDVANYVGMKLAFPKPTDIKAMTDNKINELCLKYAERKPITTRPAILGDCVIIDYSGTVDGALVKGLSEEGCTINSLGAGANVDGFDINLVGMMTGTVKEFDLKFPDGSGAMAGKTARMVVKLHNIIEVVPSAVDNDLALMTGFSSVDEMIAAVRAEAVATSDKINKGNLELQIVAKLAKENNIQVPESMVKQETTRIVSEVQASGTQITDQIAQNIESAARYNIARYVLVESIYSKEASLEITPDELDQFLDKGAKENNKSKDEFVSDLYNSNKMDTFLNILKCDKVLGFVISKAVNESEAV